ncbi:hypothetical protein CBS115989_3518 [Aspergillus niger]|nr:hypothetical protein ANI_1_3124024 [Aspergillus niger CBS 513.88]KAI2820682.1 hypothetical protein CBS115989_3518 [Aspergillus niger]KAI2833071.1 hypothetical protein CBS133816_909 [Aspergillus niger]KAI2842114.1 hypothetical protein CBS11350_6033 [Aspergillus niger]KAI2860908.1 hypothetical protein CBS11232_1151 [Aspergillus niger]KAI2880216.1 hypothetical protein CBS115988_1665 [Aspergillus niger]|eukprot:XP_001400363.2 hypothetical protein ANI_1_3124024 [Aspergillus niger CBS 513.88]
MVWHLSLIAILSLLPGALATGWDDFADDLATDLAPLISLFGERLSKQFLSESTSILDNFLFSVAPLGILTAVVSVIRVSGNSSLRAFIGRAQEGPGEAENELLSCVSETTAEMFNNGGISRVFGRPRLLEVIAWEETDPQTKERSYRIGTLRDALREGAWLAGKGSWILDEKEYLPELDIPNLSLNKGIEKSSQGWFYAAAVLGLGLQVGVIVYAAITVYLFPVQFRKDGSLVVSYAFPLFSLGSIFLCIGMFLCAFIIERSSTECYIRPAKPSKIYWLQPGGQDVGDQVFGAFLGVSEGPNSKATEDLLYIKSVRSPEIFGKGPLLMFTVVITLIGFVIQFVGIRGLHASVVLAEMGATLLMSIVRACLRTKRSGSDENRLTAQERHLVSYNEQELDCFAFHLEQVRSFGLVSSQPHRSRAQSTTSSAAASTQTPSKTPGLGTKLITTRAQLARLTSNPDKESSLAWNGLPIRQRAQKLADTIERTMDLLSGWKDVTGDTVSFDLMLTCQSLNKGVFNPALETYTIKLHRSEDTLLWKIDETELEAVLGLWTWSLLRSDSKWLQTGLDRAVGLTKSEAMAEETDLYFHKWIYRHTDARMASSKTVSFGSELFGLYSDKNPGNKEILVVKTQNNLETMAAQDIYIHFLRSVLQDFETIGSDVDVRSGSQNGYIAYSSRIDELVACFESGNLGSREDALLCIVPVLKARKLLPELAADSHRVRAQIERFISNDEWSEAFAIVRWLCERSEGQEFERSVYELGYLCQRAIQHIEDAVRKEGLDVLLSLLQGDLRLTYFNGIKSVRPVDWMKSRHQQAWWSEFSRQLGYITWHISNNKVDRHQMKASIESVANFEDLGLPVPGCDDEQNKKKCAEQTILGWLTHGADIMFERQVPGCEDQLCLEWVIQNGQLAICHWLLVKWAEVGQHYGAMAQKAFVFAARCGADSAIQTLIRHGANINNQEYEGYTALYELVANQEFEATRRLLANGADADLGIKSSGIAPLGISAGQGDERITRLLLDHGAKIDRQDRQGFSVLHLAVRHDQLAIVRLLLDRGGYIDNVAGDGRTPLTHASSDNQKEMVELLLNYGARVNVQDDCGCTPLTLAVYNYASVDIIRLLLDNKADIYQTDNNGMNALDEAHQRNRLDILALLEAASMAGNSQTST